MSTIVVVRKNGSAVIGADTLTTCGNVKESAEYVRNHQKIWPYKDNFIGISGSASLQVAVQDFLSRQKKITSLGNIADIFRFGLALHKALKDEYFLLPNDEEDFETFHGDMLILNRKGIFGLSSYRFVQEYTKFYANGSGGDFALGAMYALYNDDNLNARDIAEIGVNAGTEFDDGSAAPLSFHEIELD